MRVICFVFYVGWVLRVQGFIETAPNNLITFMKKYGYLNNENLEGRVPEADESFKTAVKTMQKYGHVPVTGNVDQNTIKLTKAKRCGVKDVEREEDGVYSFILDGLGWDKRELSYFVVNTTTKLSRQVIMEIIQKATKLWQSVSPLRFFPAQSENTADMVFTFFRGKHGPPWDEAFDGEGGTLAHAWAPMPGRRFSGHIHFDEDELWFDGTRTKGNRRGIDFYTTLVHELGHTLGLDHSEKRESVMAPYYADYKGNLKLGYDDVLAIRKLYVSSGKFGDVSMPHPRPKDYLSPTIPPPSDCAGSFDAVVHFAGYVTFFKGTVFWEMGNKFGTNRGHWLTMYHLRFAEVIEKIDAAFELEDGKVVFLTGKKFWVFEGAIPDKDSPQPITSLGFDSNVESLDAAMTWSKDQKTYIFKDDKYWCYDSDISEMEKGYPRPMSDWKNAPNGIDCALSLKNGSTYFFKGIHYWEVNDKKQLLNYENPKLVKDWLGCK